MAFIPSKETFYLIAASEMGNKAVQTPEFDKIRKIVDKFLDRQLNDDQTVVKETK